MTALSLQNLSVTLGGVRVVDDVSLEIGRGECVGLIGPNGAGKSTLLRAALGLQPCRGKSSLQTLSTAERARAAAWLPQAREIAWEVSVETLVGLGRSAHHRRGVPWSADDARIVEAVMAEVDVTHLRHRVARTLSGGEQARVLLARALAQDTGLLLADEPIAALDPAHQIATMESFARLAAEGRTVVTALHDLGLAARWCSRLVLIDKGRIVADGIAAEVLTPERLRDVYGVEAVVEAREGAMLVLPLRRAEPAQ